MYHPPSSSSPNVITSPSRGPGKRKQSDAMPGDDKSGKRRRGSQYGHSHTQDHVSGGGGASEDLLGGAVDNPGAKHWSDEEKTKFFIWLLGSDEHWEQFGTKMNTCFRECAQALFNNRKTFTALKSCYHRNLDTFKQLSTFERFNGPFEAGLVDPSNQNERQTHFEKRLEAARTAGCSIGNLSPRIVDSWVKNGWYDMFKNRFYADTNRSMLVMPSGHGGPHEREPPPLPQMSDPGPSVQVQVPDPRSSEPPPHHDHHTDQLQPPPASPPIRHPHHGMLDSSPLPTYHPTQPPQPPTQPLNQLVVAGSSSMTGIEQTVAHLTGLTQTLLATYAHMVQSQSEDSRAKLEFMKRRDEREQEDSQIRRERDKRKEDREIAELERTREREEFKQKSDIAMALVSKPNVDTGTREAAAEFLKKLFQH
ncbi:hypothetical protein BDM02DRAFT_3128709 [Thelephora ganbajun]|uniref:Uncharacterized protein n=1 Tax=Thelephora ganbajun TaxID=370292 RepID=A0ACB6ZH86_THEGA|nr:hypothetical protein BDM02DRAFT_3128709 [Thelephora ganbajun]